MERDNGLQFLRGGDIDRALGQEYRQYLTGKLTREQKHLPHIEDDIEVGVSHYGEFTADKPHVHPVATEHGYVLQGAVRVLILDGERREEEFRSGDFFVVEKGVPYATKNAPGTRVLFIKSPGINDKELVEIDAGTAAWLSSWD